MFISSSQISKAVISILKVIFPVFLGASVLGCSLQSKPATTRSLDGKGGSTTPGERR